MASDFSCCSFKDICQFTFLLSVQIQLFGHTFQFVATMAIETGSVAAGTCEYGQWKG